MLTLDDVIRNAKRHLQSEHLVTIEPRKRAEGFEWRAMGGLRGVARFEYQAVEQATGQIEQPGDEFYCADCARWNAAIRPSLDREDAARAEVPNA